MTRTRILTPIALIVIVLTQAACHTTQLGRSIGFPTPQERVRGNGF